MTAQSQGGLLYGAYRNRIGEPTTHDEVRGYWVFFVGLLLSIVGILIFLPSESAAGAGDLTLRELSIVFASVGLSMILAGFVIRLPLQPWANYAAYLGEVVCLAAAAWFMAVFPAEWSVQTGSQPVIVLYAAGLGVIAIGGVLAPLIVGVSRDDLERTQRERDAAAAERDAATAGREAGRTATGDERDRLQAELDALRRSQAQFELFEDKGGEHRWRLRHRNGNVIADSGEGYTRRHNAKKGMASVRRNALGASLLQIEPEPDEDVDTALETAPLIPEVARDSKATFDVYTDNEGDHRWRLVHDNGNVLADSGEGYASRRNATRAVESVKRNADEGSYLRFDPTAFEIYRDAGGEWRWRLVHKNGNILAAASEGYTRRRDAKRSVDSIRDDVADTGDRFEVYQDNRDEYRWRFRGANREIVATSGEGYDDESEAEAAVERVQEYAPDAHALDVGVAAFEVYEDEAEEWRWRLRHRNGNVLADGGEGYASRRNVYRAIEGVKRNVPGAEVATK